MINPHDSSPFLVDDARPDQEAGCQAASPLSIARDSSLSPSIVRNGVPVHDCRGKIKLDYEMKWEYIIYASVLGHNVWHSPSLKIFRRGLEL